MSTEPIHPAETRPGPRQARRGAELMLFILLCLLVWGLFAPDRGLWQDDALRLGHASDAMHGGETALFDPGALPSRILVPQLYLLAYSTGKPMFVLYFLYGLSWLLTGVLAAALGRALCGDERIGFLAGCLTLTATSDYLTNSLVATGYTVSQVLYMAALLAALRYVRAGSWNAFWASVVLLASSIWMSDVALVPLLLTPAILWLAAREQTRRLVRLTATWIVVAVPYVITLLHGLRIGEYGKVAILEMTPLQRLVQGLVHFAYNFTPWRWAFARPAWFPEPAPVLPQWLYAGAVALGLSAFAVAAWRLRNDEPDSSPTSPHRGPPLAFAILFGLCALGVNISYASVNASQTFYRTHLGARVWCALLLAIVLVRLCDRFASAFSIARSKAWTAAVIGAGAFVGLGIWGGIERQDFFLASWREHRRELRSLAEAAPALPLRANVVLWQPQHGTYLATDVRYLALAWMRLLHGKWRQEGVWLRSPSRKTECVGEAGGVRCRKDGCFEGGDCWSPLLPWESLVVIGFDEAKGRYRLLNRLPDELSTGNVTGAARYAPAKLIGNEHDPIVDHLLAGDRLLGRRFPDRAAATNDAPPSATVRLEFDDRQVTGSGWEPHVEGRSNKWMLAPEATLEFPVAGGSDRCLTIAIAHYLAPDIPEGLQISANGKTIALERRRTNDRLIVTGIVPREAIPEPVTRVELRFTVGRLVSPASLGLSADARPLGLLFDWLTLEPCANARPVDSPSGRSR